jgi:ferritin-like protein
MKKPTDIGTNRTGAKTSPIDSRRTIAGAKKGSAETGIESPGDSTRLEAERVFWSASAEPVGTVPVPATLRGVASTVIEVAQGHKPTVFIDKLGGRLAFERTGTRLYEAVIAKLVAADVHEGGPTRSELEVIRDDELRHAALLIEALEKLGADPTAMTPCADLVGVTGLGLIQVVTDPRTTLSQALEALLIAELTDVDAWAMLVDLATGLGHDDLAERFRAAELEEETHLARVRAWVALTTLGQSGVLPTPPEPDAAVR